MNDDLSTAAWAHTIHTRYISMEMRDEWKWCAIYAHDNLNSSTFHTYYELLPLLFILRFRSSCASFVVSIFLHSLLAPDLFSTGRRNFSSLLLLLLLFASESFTFALTFMRIHGLCLRLPYILVACDSMGYKEMRREKWNVSEYSTCWKTWWKII